MSRLPKPALRVPAARLEGLADLAGLLRDRDLARLAEAAAACTRIEARLAAIEARRRARAAELMALQVPDPALRAGMDAAWQREQGQRQRALQLDLARARAEREAAKTAALLALGRADILAGLARRRQDGGRPGA